MSDLHIPRNNRGEGPRTHASSLCSCHAPHPSSSQRCHLWFLTQAVLNLLSLRAAVVAQQNAPKPLENAVFFEQMAGVATEALLTMRPEEHCSCYHVTSGCAQWHGPMEQTLRACFGCPLDAHLPGKQAAAKYLQKKTEIAYTS